MRLSAVHCLLVYVIGLQNVRILGKSIGTSTTTTPAPLKVNPVTYLENYGYWSKREGRAEPTPHEFSLAVEKFQKFMGIPVTGRIDAKTTEVMNTRRCGFPDLHTTRGRYAYTGRQWPTNPVTWKVDKVQGGSYSRSELESLTATAAKEWEYPSLLRLEKSTATFPEPNIIVDFVDPDAQGNHGDGNAFQSDDLGHAFFPGVQPLDGDLHMNMDQSFFTQSYNPFASDMLFVLVHEFGHSLGLDHTSVRNAVMYPTLTTGRLYNGLQADDVAGIQAVYGRDPNYSGVHPMLPSLPALLIGLLMSLIYIR